MGYEYKGQFLTLAEMYLNTGNHEPNLEIEEVYHKAEYYDRFIEDIKKYYSGVPFDATLHDVVAKHYFNKEE